MKLKFDKNVKYCFFDYETEGLNLGTKKPVQAAYYLYDGNGHKEEKTFFINWELVDIPIKIDFGASKATGIYREQVIEEGIHPEDALELNNLYFNQGDYVAGHNILGYDFHIYSLFCKLLKRKPLELTHKCLDTLALAKGLNYEIHYKSGMNLFNYMLSLTNYWEKTKKKMNLSALAKDLDITFDKERMHNALYDIKINAKVWEKLKYQFDL